MTLHYLGGIIAGISGIATAIGGIFSGGGGQTAPPPTPTPKTDWTPLYIIGGLLLVVMLFKK